MTAFYQDIITQKSWELLQKLKKKIDFILIGGWAVYLYTKALKSRDIDIIVGYQELAKIKKLFETSKNERLKKYEAKSEGVDIDIYLPHYSNLGLPVEKIIKFQEKVETFNLLKKEVLLITKQAAYKARSASVKGQKDKIDIVSLILLEDFDVELYKMILTDNRLQNYSDDLKSVLIETVEAKELGLNRHAFAKRKKSIFKAI